VLILALVFTSEFIFKTYSAPMAREVSSEATLSAAPSQENARDVPEQPQIFTWGGAYGMGGGARAVSGAMLLLQHMVWAAAYPLALLLSAIPAKSRPPNRAKSPHRCHPKELALASAETPEEEAPQAQVFSAREFRTGRTAHFRHP
jgi:hypothetical protein